MATHAQNISNLENAVFGEQVRRSMVELFEEDYSLVKKAIGFGTDINSPTSSTVGYYDGNLYINSDTMDIWEMDGYGWHIVGNVKSIKDITVVESQLDDGFNVITITLTNGTTKTVNIKNGSKGSTGIGVADVVDNGDGTFRLKLEDGTITPSTIATIQGEQGIQGIQGIQGVAGKGVTSITSIDAGKNHTLVANFTDGTSNNITTLRDGSDGTGSGDMTKATYDVNDNGIVDYAEALKDNLGNVLTYADVANKATKATTLAGYGITDAVQAPTSEGTAGQALITDGAGGRSWGDVSSLINDVNASEFKVTSKKLFLADDITKKLPTQFLGSISGAIATFTDPSIGTKDYMFDIYCSNSERYIKSQSTSGNTLTVEFNDSVVGMVCVAVAIEKGV